MTKLLAEAGNDAHHPATKSASVLAGERGCGLGGVWPMDSATRSRLLLMVGALIAFGIEDALAEPECSARERASVGRLLMVKSSEPDPQRPQPFEDWLAGRPVGGIYLSKSSTRELGSPDAVAAYIRRLTSTQSETIFVSIDQEGGRWQGLDEANGFAALPSAAQLCETVEIGRMPDVVASGVGEPLAQVGVTMNFAPVLDVGLNPDSEIITRLGRACSADPAMVAAYGVAVAEGLTMARVVPVGKHFPGHGDVAGDTHAGMVRSTKPLARLVEEDLAPFRAFIDRGGPAVMVSHIITDALDGHAPASLSREAIGYLRGEMGFDGLVVTDDMSMGAVREFVGGAPGEAGLMALRAGADLIVIGRTDYDNMVERVCAALHSPAGEEGEEIAERISTSVRRIEAVTSKYGLDPAGD